MLTRSTAGWYFLTAELQSCSLADEPHVYIIAGGMIIPSQVHGLAFVLGEFHKFPVCLFIVFCQVPLKIHLAFQCVLTGTPKGWSYKWTWWVCTLSAYSQCFEQHIFQDRPLRNITCNYPLDETWTSNYHNDPSKSVCSFCPHTYSMTSQDNRDRLYPPILFPNSAILS